MLMYCYIANYSHSFDYSSDLLKPLLEMYESDTDSAKLLVIHVQIKLGMQGASKMLAMMGLRRRVVARELS
jgi:hypothetical protein